MKNYCFDAEIGSQNVALRAQVFIWALAGAIALAFALRWMPATAIDGVVIPAGHDSLYHAARIQDVVDGRGLSQFDERIHAPEGSWVPWPWGYDLALGWLAKAGMAVTGAESPMRVLIWLPPLWVLVNAALVLGIAGALGLSLALRAIALGCFAFSPLTQVLHGAGRIDHHFAEQTAVLLVLLLGLRWLRKPGHSGLASMLGGSLALVTAIHNGLFLLQVPIVLTFLVLWVRRATPPWQSILTFSGTLAVAQTLVLLPSDPFLSGINSYQLLSWFHLNVAAGTILVALWVSRFELTSISCVGLGLAGTLLALPLLLNTLDGLAFIRAEEPEFQILGETRGLLVSGTSTISMMEAARAYTALIWLLPLAVAWSVWKIFRGSEPAATLFHFFVISGAVILSQQYRFHQLGSFALYFPWLLMAQTLRTRRPGRLPLVVTTIIMVAAYFPARSGLLRLPLPGFSTDYFLTSRIYPPLAEACRKEPGIVLADAADGHPIRFHTRCSVVANNLILTPISRAKVYQANALLRLSADELRRQAPWIRYVIARREDNILDPSQTRDEIERLNQGLRQELLLGENVPVGYQLVAESLVVVPPSSLVVAARVFRINPLNVGTSKLQHRISPVIVPDSTEE